MNAPRVISLDLDDTLWPLMPLILAAERALLAWMQERYPAVARGASLESMRRLRARVAAEFPERSHDMTYLRRRALDEQFAAAGHSDSAAAEAFEIFMIERNRVQPYPDVRPALARLHARHRLFAISNGNADLRRCGFAEYFEGHVTAIAAGAGKPDPRIFALLLRNAGVAADEMLHVGDDPLADVVGATRAGMRAVWLNREGREWPVEFAAPACTVSTLAEIT